MPGRKPVMQCTQSEWKHMTDRMRSCCPAPQGYSWRFMWSTKCLSDGNRGDCERREPKTDKDGKKQRGAVKALRGKVTGED